MFKQVATGGTKLGNAPKKKKKNAVWNILQVNRFIDNR